MKRHLGWRAAPTALLSAVLALSACAGGGISPTPGVPGAGSTVEAQHVSLQLHDFSAGVRPNATCPTKYIICYTVSQKSGLVVDWCYGSASQPCSQTSQYVWSGNVCRVKTPSPCGPIGSMRAKWTGPFACKASIGVCKGGTTGTYVVDTIKTAKLKPPKQTMQYAYKQDIILSGTLGGDMGLNVGP